MSRNICLTMQSTSELLSGTYCTMETKWGLQVPQNQASTLYVVNAAIYISFYRGYCK